MKRGCLISVLIVGALLGAWIYSMWPYHWANSHSVFQLGAISDLRTLYGACLEFEERTGAPPSGWDDFDPEWSAYLQKSFLRQSDADEMIVHWEAFAKRHTDPHVVFVEFPGVTMRYGKRAHDMAWIRSMQQLACGRVDVEYTRGDEQEAYEEWFPECAVPYQRLELELHSGDDDALVARCTVVLPGLLPATWTLDVVDTSSTLATGAGEAYWTRESTERESRRVVRLHPGVVDHGIVLTVEGDTGTWTFATDAGIEESGRLVVLEWTSERIEYPEGLAPGLR